MSLIRVAVIVLAIIEQCGALQCKEKQTYFNKTVADAVENVDYHPCYRACEYPVKPRVCEYDFTATWTRSLSGFCLDCPLNQDDCGLKGCIPLDGHSRLIAVINGKTPGPSIQVCQGDTIRVKVTNHLQDHGGLSIHWHGPHQNGSNWMDGVSMITQCPIAHASHFVYEFLADPAGTHWWHAHSGLYRADGVYGSLIIRKSNHEERTRHLYDLDSSENVMILSDWGPYTALQDYISLITFSEPPHDNQQTILVNGKSRGREFTDANGKIVYTPRSVFHVKPGVRYRFRVISSAILACNIRVSVDGHFMWIIATDGSDVREVMVDSFVIASGERYDFVIAASAVPMSYLIRVEGVSDGCDYNGDAVLCYRDAPCVDPTTLPWPIQNPFSSLLKDKAIAESYLNTFNLFDTYALDIADPDLDTVDITAYLMFSILKSTWDKTSIQRLARRIPKINNVQFEIPPTPVLQKMPENICEPHINVSMMRDCQDRDCRCVNILKIKLGQVVELVIANMDGDLSGIDHPTHIHGQSGRVVGYGRFDGTPETLDDIRTLDELGNLTRINIKDAVIKDTVLVPHHGYVIFRWKATNPGIWFFHCHIENHLEDGMAMIFQVGEDHEIMKPPQDFPTCGPWPLY